MENDFKSIMEIKLTRKEVIEQLAIARKNAEEGRVMETHQASDNVRKKYGL